MELIDILKNELNKIKEIELSKKRVLETYKNKDENLENLITKLNNKEVLNDSEIIILKNEIVSLSIEDNIEDLINKMPFLKRMDDFFKNNVKIDNSFKEQYETYNKKLINLIELLTKKYENQTIENHYIYKKIIDELIDIKENVDSINNLINVLLGNSISVQEEDYEILVDIIDEIDSLSEKEKKMIFLDFVTYVFKLVENTKDNKESNTILETTINIINDDEMLQTNLNENSELIQKKDKLISIFRSIYNYLDKVYIVAKTYNVDLNNNVFDEERFESAYSCIIDGKDNVKDSELIKYISLIINNDYELFKTHVFNKSFQLYKILETDYENVLEIYENIEKLEKFVYSLDDIEKLEEYISLLNEPLEYLKATDINNEIENFINISKYLIIDDKGQEISNLDNIGENIIIFADGKLSETIDINENTSETLKEGIRIMRDTSYTNLGQKQSSNIQRISNIKGDVPEALEKENVYTKVYRKNTLRVAFIPLSVSEKVKSIINKYFECNLASNRVLLVFGFEELDDKETYKIFNKSLGKKELKGNRGGILKNSNIFNIADLFKLENPTEKEIDEIIDVIHNGDNIYKTIVGNTLKEELSI